MFQINDITQSKVYQEALQEGKLEGKLDTVAPLIQMGLSVEQISLALGVDVKVVRKAAKKRRMQEQSS